jgi:hypothetical protein
MFPNVRLLIAAVIATVVVLSCGFGMLAAFRVNHEPFARLPSGAAPLQLLASISPWPPIIVVAAVESLDRGLRTADTRAGVDLVDAQAHAPTASDRAAGAPVAEPETSAPASADASATVAAQETRAPEPQRETSSPAAEAAVGDTAPAPAAASAPALGMAAVEAPASQSVMIERAGQDTLLVPASLPAAPVKATKTAATKKKHTRLAAKAHRTRRPVWEVTDGLATANTRESTSAVGGPFVSPAAW